MTDAEKQDDRAAVGSPVERIFGRPANEGTAPACEHPSKVETHFTYGYRWHCPDCKASGEDWWD